MEKTERTEKTARVKKPELICDRCNGNEFEHKNRTDPSDGTKLTICKACGYIMLSDGKKIEGKSRMPSRNTDEAILAYAKTLEKAE